MRPNEHRPAPRRAGLIILSAAVLFCATGAAPADNILLSKEIAGYGQTQKDAEQDALDKARVEVSKLLPERNPDSGWSPNSQYLLESGMVHQLSHDPNFPSDLIGPHHRVTIRLEVREQDVARMLRQDLLRERHLITFKLLLALAALLGVVAGYFRLEEATRGYYTGRLRAALVLSVLAIGAGLWLAW